MQHSKQGGIGLKVRDISGQKQSRVSNVPGDATVSEFVRDLVTRLKLPTNGTRGEPLHYQARLERGSRRLLPSDRMADVLQEDDEVTLLRNVDAG